MVVKTKVVGSSRPVESLTRSLHPLTSEERHITLEACMGLGWWKPGGRSTKVTEDPQCWGLKWWASHWDGANHEHVVLPFALFDMVLWSVIYIYMHTVCCALVLCRI